jgi:hypothetical protein
MTEDEIAGIALRDVVTLGGRAAEKVGHSPEDQQLYWEWLATSTLSLGFQLMLRRNGVEGAREWLSRSFVAFSALIKEQGHDIKVYIARELGDSPS